MFKGSNVALITPFKDNKLDEESYIKIINHHLENGTNGLVPVGTTGESPTLSHDEHERTIELCIKEATGKLPIIAGTGSNSTEEAVSHYKSINDNCGIPIIIYNIPSRSVIDMSVETMARLYELKNIVGVKDATGDLNRVDQQKEKMGNDFIQLTGNDDNAFEFNKRGGVGTISVTANVAPKLCSEFQKLSKSSNEDDLKKAQQLDDMLQPLHKNLFIESNPSPVKYAAKLLGLCDDTVRLPLVKITENTKKEVEKALKVAKLIDE